jgi:hypothetical protein
VSVTTLFAPLGVAVVAAELVAVFGEAVSLIADEVVDGAVPVAVVVVSVELVVVDAVTLEPGVALAPELLYAVLVAGVLLQPARAIAAMASAARIGEWRVMEISRNVGG